MDTCQRDSNVADRNPTFESLGLHIRCDVCGYQVISQVVCSSVSKPTPSLLWMLVNEHRTRSIGHSLSAHPRVHLIVRYIASRNTTPTVRVQPK
jgi:hypothetical protein